MRDVQASWEEVEREGERSETVESVRMTAFIIILTGEKVSVVIGSGVGRGGEGIDVEGDRNGLRLRRV